MATAKARSVRKNKSKTPESAALFEVDFVLACSGAEQVHVCGDFNGWQPTSLRMTAQSTAGVWETRLMLAAGRYEYKFLVDGKWVHDPNARQNVPNSHGTLNSVREVQL